MALHQISKGLDLPIKGGPEQKVRSDSPSVSSVALLGHDYPTMKPRMHVNEGDQVKRGQLLFEDRKAEGVRFTAPGAGTVKAVNRGEKRVFQSLVIELTDSEKEGKPTDDDFMTFESYQEGMLNDLTGEQARELLSESGLWTSLRTRPYSRVPSIGDECAALFVTAIDTSPLAPSVEVALEGREDDFKAGLQVLSTLTEGKLFLCVGPKWQLDVGEVDRLSREVFVGPHPAGLVGTHIHLLAPASRKRTVWHVGYQDVAAIGALFTTGKLDVARVISLAGPVAKAPGLLTTRLGASVAELTEGELTGNVETRVVSGSVLFGHSTTDEPFAYLHRYDNQLSCLEEDRERVFVGWLRPGGDKFSTVRAFLSRWLPVKKEFAMTTTTHGSHRAMVPIGMFERVMPLDVLPTFLLRSLMVSDLERAEQLGCLELHEEDLGLCSFVSPGKEDYGKSLRKVLTEIWQEG